MNTAERVLKHTKVYLDNRDYAVAPETIANWIM